MHAHTRVSDTVLCKGCGKEEVYKLFIVKKYIERIGMSRVDQD